MRDMTPDELEAFIDQFEEVLIGQYHDLNDKGAKKRAEMMADSLGDTNTASLLHRAIDASGPDKRMFANRHIESARGWLEAMRKQNRVW